MKPPRIGATWWLVRQAFAVLVLPVTVAVVIPVWIARSEESPIALPASWAGWALLTAGVPVLLVGGALFVSCVARFGQEGAGTLAPWDPPVNLVVSGSYAYVRNPMISGVILILIAEAMLLRSFSHLEWAGLFFVINAIYIPLLEEPMLRARFGEEYEVYARHVPRLIPRIRPYDGKEHPRSRPDPADKI